MSLLAMGAMAAGSALASSAAQNGGNIASVWGTNSARESLNKNIGKTNLKLQKEYDLWTMQQDAAYERWYQDLMYKLQANEYYDLARKYGENTASWAVEGLKKAGLNPVLAAIDGNLSSSLGNAGPQGSAGRHAKGSIPSASAPGAPSIGQVRLSAMQDLANSAKQGALMDAQKANIDADTKNKQANEGLSGSFAAVANVLENAGLKEPLKKLAREGANWIQRKLGTDSSPSTGKGISDSDVDRFADSVGKGIPPSLHDSKPDKLSPSHRDLRNAYERNQKREMDEFRATGRYPSPFRW